MDNVFLMQKRNSVGNLVDDNGSFEFGKPPIL